MREKGIRYGLFFILLCWVGLVTADPVSTTSSTTPVAAMTQQGASSSVPTATTPASQPAVTSSNTSSPVASAASNNNQAASSLAPSAPAQITSNTTSHPTATSVSSSAPRMPSNNVQAASNPVPTATQAIPNAPSSAISTSTPAAPQSATSSPVATPSQSPSSASSSSSSQANLPPPELSPSAMEMATEQDTPDNDTMTAAPAPSASSAPVLPEGYFVVRAIQFQGLERVTQGTALSYLPIKVGDVIGPNDTANIIRSLYQTGFFSNIQLFRSGNTLIIQVSERPVIGSIKISGNKAIETKKLTEALDKIGLSEGETFNSSMLEEVKQALLQEYYSRGNYSVKIDANATPEPRNRVNVSIQIDEGTVAKIRQIKIIGNEAFSQRKLLKQFKLSTPNLLTWITDNDLYSKEKLDADLQQLKTFYLDNGYIKFKIDSTQVSITPDRKNVYIVVRVTEGPQYKFSGYQLQGNLIVPKAQLEKEINIKPGDVFSRQVIVDTEKTIAQQLGDLGYLFVQIKPIPQIDEENKTVNMVFDVTPGQRIYVHQINFVGNTKTSDDVLRRAMRQQEGSIASLSAIKESERQLKLLPYLKNIDVKTTPTPNTNNEVDLAYGMTEQESAELSLSLGYSDTYGLLYGIGVNQSDFLGSGKSLGVNFTKDEYERNISLSYNNPYYTISGIQRGFSIYSQKFEPGAVNIADYTMTQNGAQVNYSIPVSENSAFNLGGGIQNINVDAGTSPSTQVADYLALNGDVFNQILLNGGWNYNGYDQIIFPTQGFSQSVTGTLSVPITNHPLEYWEVGYEAHLYQPLVASKDWILSLRGQYDHGQSYGQTQGFPFFENFYAGGIGTVRGYEGNTLGPQDSNGNALGGNNLLDGSAEIILPPWFSPNIRTTVFMDGGNVYDGSIQSTQLRYSAGLDVQWRIPMLGPLEFALAYPLNKQPGDDTEPFQFQIGTTF